MDQLTKLLKNTYLQRAALNKLYSQNAFARDLGVSPTALSQVLSGKRSFSPQNVRRIVKSLYLPPDSEKQFRKNASSVSLGLSLEMEKFLIIAEWYHFGILNLATTDTVKNSVQISRRLGISREEADQAIERLIKLKMLKIEKGILKRTHLSLDAGTDIPSAALRKHNRGKMELAIESLETVSIEKRDISSLTIAFDEKDMKKVKDEIQKFKKRIQKICSGKNPTEVYSMNVQFYPLTKKEVTK